MRYAALMALALAAGCMQERPPSAAEVHLMQMCQQGAADACQAVVQAEQAREADRQALVRAYMNRPSLQQQPVRTKCRPLFGTLRCTTY